MSHRQQAAMFAHISALVIGMVAVTTPALAKENQSDFRLEEVIVSAQRRDESAQDVAISVSVFNQEQLSNANISNPADLALITPSLSVNTLFGPDNAAFNIRGFSKELRTTATVGVYFAEAVAPRGQILQTSGDGAGPGTMFDLQSLQVLKGPQGTLFGRNTTGGAVLLVPERPSDQFEGYVEVSGAERNMLEKQLVLNVPVNDQLRMRFGIDTKDSDGYLNNLSDKAGRNFGDSSFFAGRISLEANITETLSDYLVLNYSDSESHGSGPKLFACNSAAATALVRPGACERQLERQRAAGDNFYDVISTVPNAGVEIQELRFINHLSWDVTENISLKSILAYMHLETSNNQDVFGTEFTETQAALTGIGIPSSPVDANREYLLGYSIAKPGVPVTSQETRAAEFQVQGLSLANKLNWQAGVYYENSIPDGYSGNYAPSQISCDLRTIATGDPAQFNCNDPLGGALGGVGFLLLKTEYTNQAVYAQATYDILDSLSFTGGLRYTKDNTVGEAIKTRYKFTSTVLTETAITDQYAEQDSEAPTGLIELQYKPAERIMTYAKYVRGYRQGGVNLVTDSGVDVHDKETVDNYEIGAKTEFDWPLPTRFNVSVFENDLTDMQLQTGFLSPTSGSTTAIFNAGRASIKGFEFDGFVQLHERLTASFSYSYLDSELLEQDIDENRQRVGDASGPVASATFTPTAVVGDELPYTPKESYTASLNYRAAMPHEMGELQFGGTYAYTGEQRATASTFSPYSVIEEFSVINLHLNWNDMFGEAFDLSLFATNVTDEEYVTFLAGTYNALGLEVRSSGQPRTIGARLKYSFGANK